MQRIKLEHFGVAEPESDHVTLLPAEIEKLRSAGFEEGYQAGWNDAGSARDNDDARACAAVLQNLQDLSFTYHEVRQHLLTQLEPLFHEIVQQVLPDMARQGLATQVVAVIQERAADLACVPVRVHAHETVIAQVRELLSGAGGIPVDYDPTPPIAPDSAYVTFADAEVKIDPGTLVGQISTIVSGYFKANQKDNHDE